MSRILLAMVFAVGIAGAANALVVQYSVDGVPIGAGEVIEVVPSQIVTIDIYVDGEGDTWNAVTVELLGTGDWDPIPASEGDIRFLGGFNNAWAYWDPGWSELGVWDDLAVHTADPIAEWDVHIPELPESTILNLEFAYVEVGGGTYVGGNPVGIPLVLHVAPEPATLGLLVLGGLAALRRRFA